MLIHFGPKIKKRFAISFTKELLSSPRNESNRESEVMIIMLLKTFQLKLSKPSWLTEWMNLFMFFYGLLAGGFLGFGYLKTKFRSSHSVSREERKSDDESMNNACKLSTRCLTKLDQLRANIGMQRDPRMHLKRW